MHVPSSLFPTVHSHSPDHSRRVRCRRSGQWAKGQGTVCNIAQDWLTRLKFVGAETTVLLRNKWYQFTNVKHDDSDDEKRKWCPTGKDVKQNVDQVLERGTQPLPMAVSTHRVLTKSRGNKQHGTTTSSHNPHHVPLWHLPYVLLHSAYWCSYACCWRWSWWSLSGGGGGCVGPKSGVWNYCVLLHETEVERKKEEGNRSRSTKTRCLPALSAWVIKSSA